MGAQRKLKNPVIALIAVIAVIVIICLIVAVRAASGAAGEEFVFQYGLNGYEMTMDTHITEYPGNNGNNMGGNLENECCEYNPANVDGKSILIWFDVSSISKNAVVGNTTLELYMTSTRNGNNEKEVAVHQLLKSWEEGTGTGIDGVAAKGEEACGRWTGTGDVWAKVGADEPGEDFVAEPNDTLEIAGGINEWYSWDVAEMCQNWVREPDKNFGAIVLEPRPHANTTGTKVFASKDNPNPDIRPRLVVVVTAFYVDVSEKFITTWGDIKD